jgi:hypothetical protein
VYLNLGNILPSILGKKQEIRKVVQRCALLSKSSTKMTFQLRVSMDFKIALYQCIVWTSKEGFLSLAPNPTWPRESIGHYTGLGQGILLELNPNILVRDDKRRVIVF